MIHYTIIATNDGNIDAAQRDVTDAQVTNLVCTPANPVASLAPGGIDHLHGQPHDHPGRPRRRAASSTRPASTTARAGRPRRVTTSPRRARRTRPDDHQGRDRDRLQRGRRRDPLHDHGDQQRQRDAHNVDVTDAERQPTWSARRRPGRQPGSGRPITCTASHTITQADLDAGASTTRPASTTAPAVRPQACDDVDHAGHAEPEPDDHEGRDRDGLQRGRRRHPLHDHGDQQRQRHAAQRDRDRRRSQQPVVHADYPGGQPGAGRDDHLHGQPHDHPGRPRRRQLLQPGLRRRRRRWGRRGL